MSDPVHVAFDLGAESGRAMVGSFSGGRLELDEVCRFPTPSVRLPDGLYWDALGLYRHLTTALADVNAAGRKVRSVGIDSWAVDFGLLDRNGALIRNPLSYRDGRGADGLADALQRVSAEAMYAATGIQFLPINTVFQLLALDGAGALDQAETMLLIPDLLAYWLTGEKRAEVTNASTTQLLDARRGDWSVELIEQVGLPERIFPPIVEPGSILAGLLPHVADATGLPSSTPVAVVASHDTASAVVAAPLGAAGAAYISSGTWSLVGVEIDEPMLTAQAHAANLTNERGFGGTIRLLKNVMGLWLLQECRRTWQREGGVADYAELAALAASEPGGFLFDPDLPWLLVPGDMPTRICEACARTGQQAPPSRSGIVRAIFESLACKYRQVLDDVESVTGQTLHTIHVIGGGARNELLCRLTADVSGRVVVAGPVEGAALGNVLVQMHAFGTVGSLAEMREIVRNSTRLVTYEPDAMGERWSELYERFRAVPAWEAVIG